MVGGGGRGGGMEEEGSGREGGGREWERLVWGQRRGREEKGFSVKRKKKKEVFLKDYF